MGLDIRLKRANQEENDCYEYGYIVEDICIDSGVPRGMINGLKAGGVVYKDNYYGNEIEMSESELIELYKVFVEYGYGTFSTLVLAAIGDMKVNGTKYVFSADW